jgi:hypothetical protein
MDRSIEDEDFDYGVRRVCANCDRSRGSLRAYYSFQDQDDDQDYYGGGTQRSTTVQNQPHDEVITPMDPCMVLVS